MPISDYTDLKTLTVDQLIALRDTADGLIRERIGAEKRDLQAKLERIAEFESRLVHEPSDVWKTQRQSDSANRQRRLAPKYRDPETGQTWAGRGLQPRWLRAAIAAGKSPDEFSISES